ncbi:MAG: ribonucleoside-diphosphate reductase, adenosylcobalamin-dependent [Thiobacillus sp. 63-78]|uniref:adenosylcobalamin-dependent ribonucleoside-diphosphate reductase n=1 Tax=Thiobacillus sp. 63-78 TaxID=1895859 RepID=UPI000968FECD|nr:adenosylcobalamin-dependent ribonucleoside-diphosphate reductase [Thiobacillus sp. 63-78]OJZ15609.1 MAG: ribonucleoside-diphosphate reductase, adenosylcobalamin-dependent [Thiobacillus sp. 63-78]
MKTSDPFSMEISRHIWETRYRAADEPDIRASWRRVAQAIAQAETDGREQWAGRFATLLDDFRFLPGGRILAGAGTDRRVTLFNCFVMGEISDDLEHIFEALKEGALTMQHGGGVGYDFSTLRPAGTVAAATGSIASGPVSFMHIWDAMCATLLSTGARRGAMMATLRGDHPDIETFVEAKRNPAVLRHFNLSVLVSDAFMAAVADNADWPLVFPLRAGETAGGPLVERRWSGSAAPLPCRIARVVKARDLWQRILRAAYDTAEPGVLFIDPINRENTLHDREILSATNPCGEIPLPPYGACDLGSLNLTAFVVSPFGADARLDFAALADAATLAVRFLDNVIDVSRYPLPAQAREARVKRRIGLGITGLADALVLLGLRYDSDAARQLAAQAMQTVRDAAYRASIGLAREKGTFPAFDRDAFLASGFALRLPPDIRGAIAAHGIRNSHVLAIAPAGTISLLANNLSSGIEPVFSAEAERRVLEADGRYRTHRVVDYAVHRWQQQGRAGLPPTLIEAQQIDPLAHLQMQAALQPLVDNAISKTINVAADIPFERFKDLYHQAHALGLKGCTVFRPNPITGAILSEPDGERVRCCGIEREAD